MSFDRLAPHYRWLEAVLAGGVLQRARVAHLPSLDPCAHVLLAGEGPGRFLQALRQRNPSVKLTVVDQSAAMLRAAERRCPGGPTQFLQVDLRQWTAPPGIFDGIVTCCALDCFDGATLPGVISRLATSARPRATWLVTDFTLPASGWRRTRAQLIHRLMYASFRVATRLEATRLTPPDPFLGAEGFVLARRRTFNAGLLQSDLWQRGAEARV